MKLRDELIARFFRYAAIDSQSDERSQSLPSTSGQMDLAVLLAAEMRALGLEDVTIDDQAIVTAVKRGNQPAAARIGFIAHLDTVDVGLSATVRPQVLRFEGEDLCLDREQDTWLRVADHPEIRSWEGEEIILGDGSSVLGADNKAAISIIMTLLNRLDSEGEHGDIAVAFVPDEEIGMRGAKALDFTRFACDFAYTIDCCELGEVVTENFNAATAEIVFKGVTAHPMSAKGVLVNPLLMALDFVAHFDRCETPEYTAGREGFFWFKAIAANDSEARLTVLIRDFDRGKFQTRKQKIADVVGKIRWRYPTGRIEHRVTDSYDNIGRYLEENPRPMTLLLAALCQLDIDPKPISMRGGTDGAVLSARGLTTPNFFTGAYNFHSRFEFLPVLAFEKAFECALRICILGKDHAFNISSPTAGV